jgi:hypothetical protein
MVRGTSAGDDDDYKICTLGLEGLTGQGGVPTNIEYYQGHQNAVLEEQ